MTKVPEVDFVGADERELSDKIRPECPVVRNASGEWVLLRHGDVVAAATDDVSFSSAVSSHLQIPNGLDGDEHAAARGLIDAYLSAEALASFIEKFAQTATEVVAEAPRDREVDVVGELGAKYAVRAMTQWLGWDSALETRLVAWVRANQEATRSGDRQRTAKVAAEFDQIIREVIAPRRKPDSGFDDVTAQLIADTSLGHELSDDELVSILRNWTGGDLGSMALCIGVVVEFLARHPEIQSRLRSGEASDKEVDAIIDEILRIDDPFVSNRRRTTCPVQVGEVEIPAGEVVRLNWTSANRDEERFSAPAIFDPEVNAAHNLVYGIGRHACPGRLLSTIELRCMVVALLAGTRSIALATEQNNEREISPVGGYREVWAILS